MNLEEAMEYVHTAKAMYTLAEYEHGALFEFLSHVNFEKGSTVVELGCCYGRTSLLLAYICQRQGWNFHAVDAFVLSEESEYRQVMDASGLPYKLHVGLTGTAPIPGRPEREEIEWTDFGINFLLIDASHNEPWFSSDCIKWLPFVAPGGIVAFDDWGDPNPPEPANPHWAVAQFGEMFTKNWGDLGWCGRLRIKQKPKYGF